MWHELRLVVVPHCADAGAEKVHDQVGAGDVEVREVGAVGLVEVVVCFEERGAGGGYDGLEEGVWWDRGGLDIELVGYGAKDANLRKLS